MCSIKAVWFTYQIGGVKCGVPIGCPQSASKIQAEQKVKSTCEIEVVCNQEADPRIDCLYRKSPSKVSERLRKTCCTKKALEAYYKMGRI